MEKSSYDATLKGIVDPEPGAWPAFLGMPTGASTVVDSDVGTVLGAADKVVLVRSVLEYVLHLEFVAGHDAAGMIPLVLARNVLLGRRHSLPVQSVVVILRAESNSPQLTGSYESVLGGKPYLRFTYKVVRVWREPVQRFLKGACRCYRWRRLPP